MSQFLLTLNPSSESTAFNAKGKTLKIKLYWFFIAYSWLTSFIRSNSPTLIEKVLKVSKSDRFKNKPLGGFIESTKLSKKS